MTKASSLVESEDGFEIEYSLPFREERVTYRQDDSLEALEDDEFKTYVLKVLDNDVFDDETVLGVEEGTLKPFPLEPARREFALEYFEGGSVNVVEKGERNRNYTMNLDCVSTPVREMLGSQYSQVASKEF